MDSQYSYSIAHEGLNKLHNSEHESLSLICSLLFQMLAVKEQIRDLNQQHKELLESKSARDITQEFVIRSKQRDLSIACKVSVYYILLFISINVFLTIINK